VQRGGAPATFDRLLATKLGAAAVESFYANEHGILLGMINGKVASTPLSEVVTATKPLDTRLLELAQVLAL
jgi:6-phosphofructokinase 1